MLALPEAGSSTITCVPIWDGSPWDLLQVEGI
jgi:hypothetical protein